MDVTNWRTNLGTLGAKTRELRQGSSTSEVTHAYAQEQAPATPSSSQSSFHTLLSLSIPGIHKREGYPRPYLTWVNYCWKFLLLPLEVMYSSKSPLELFAMASLTLASPIEQHTVWWSHSTCKMSLRSTHAIISPVLTYCALLSTSQLLTEFLLHSQHYSGHSGVSWCRNLLLFYSHFYSSTIKIENECEWEDFSKRCTRRQEVTIAPAIEATRGRARWCMLLSSFSTILDS